MSRRYCSNRWVSKSSFTRRMLTIHRSQEYLLRIEGMDSTIFEGPVYSTFGNITTKSAGARECDGRNSAANPLPGNTALNSLYYASLACGFSFDGTYDPNFNDIIVTSIGDTTQTPTEFWGLFIDFTPATVEGCELEYQPASSGQEVLLAFNAFTAQHLAKLTASATTVKVGGSITFTVVDGMTGAVLPGAQVANGVTDSNGEVTIAFDTAGAFSIKAGAPNTIRSN